MAPQTGTALLTFLRSNILAQAPKTAIRSLHTNSASNVSTRFTHRALAQARINLAHQNHLSSLQTHQPNLATTNTVAQLKKLVETNKLLAPNVCVTRFRSFLSPFTPFPLSTSAFTAVFAISATSVLAGVAFSTAALVVRWGFGLGAPRGDGGVGKNGGSDVRKDGGFGKNRS